MKRIHFLAAPAALILWSLAPAYAAPKSNNESPSVQAKAMFEQIDAWSASVADTAFRLGQLAKNARDADSHLQGLADLRDSVNNIGSDLRSLEAERGSLSEWERTALDQILPLMHDVADNAEKAIRTFNSNRQGLFATAYADDTARITKDADDVTTLLSDYLKLAKTREKELRLEHSLGETSGF